MVSVVRRIGVVLAATTVMLGLNSLWYAVLMKGFYDRETGPWGAIARDEPWLYSLCCHFFPLPDS